MTRENKLTVVAILVMTLVFGALALYGMHASKWRVVGDYYFSHVTYTEEVYVIVRENGDEAYCVGLDNLIHSLEVYEKNGTLGKKVPAGKSIGD